MLTGSFPAQLSVGAPELGRIWDRNDLLDSAACNVKQGLLCGGVCRLILRVLEGL